MSEQKPAIGHPATRDDRPYAFGTRVIHGGQFPDPATGAVMPPIYATSTYAQASPGVNQGFDYSRSQNPHAWALERSVANLEGGAQAFAFSSGMAATSTVLELLPAGSLSWRATICTAARAACSSGCAAPRPDIRSTTSICPGWRICRRRCAPRPRCLWVEDSQQPAAEDRRPGGACRDLPQPRHRERRRQHVRKPCRAAAARTRVRHRRAFVNKVLERSFGRHRRHRRGERTSGMRRTAGASCVLQNAVGAIAGPFDSFLTLRGIKTLGLRMTRHSENALRLASWLEEQPQVRSVRYPGLPSHPQHELARSQMRAYGGSSRSTSTPILPFAPIPRELPSVHAGRELGRRGEPDRTSGPHDACKRSCRCAREVGNLGRPDTAFRRYRRPGGPARRPGHCAGGAVNDSLRRVRSGYRESVSIEAWHSPVWR